MLELPFRSWLVKYLYWKFNLGERLGRRGSSTFRRKMNCTKISGGSGGSGSRSWDASSLRQREGSTAAGGGRQDRSLHHDRGEQIKTLSEHTWEMVSWSSSRRRLTISCSSCSSITTNYRRHGKVREPSATKPMGFVHGVASGWGGHPL